MYENDFDSERSMMDMAIDAAAKAITAQQLQSIWTFGGRTSTGSGMSLHMR